MNYIHTHWCFLTNHYYPCWCSSELPVNKACKKCIQGRDKEKDHAVQDALEKIMDKDPSIHTKQK